MPQSRSRKRTYARRSSHKRHTSWFSRIRLALILAAVIAGVLVFGYLYFVHPIGQTWHQRIHAYHNPEGYDVRGIDISHYQSNIDWVKLRNADINHAPIRFVFIKATEGEDLIDKDFKQSIAAAHENDFIVGAYHFFNPNGDPLRQAAFFCKQVTLQAGDLPPVLDVERRGKLPDAVFREHVLMWLNAVEEHYGVRPIIYTGVKFKMKHLSDPIFDRYPFWIAHYYVDKLTYEGHWDFWQYTDAGKVDGIKGYVDMNIFRGKLSELLELTIPKKEPMKPKQTAE